MRLGAPKPIGVLFRFTCILIAKATATTPRELEALNWVRLGASCHITLLQQPCDNLLHVVKVIGAFDLRVLIVVTSRVKPLNTFPIGKLQVTVCL